MSGGDVRAGTPEAIAEAAQILRDGGLVAFPTETVYGLGACATDGRALARLYAVKGRPTWHPVIVHLADASDVGAWAAAIPEAARTLAERFWPGPLTLLLPKRASVPDLVTGASAAVGLRVPSHPVALALLRETRTGVAAPSANRFGKVSPTTAQHVAADLGADVDRILDGGASEVGLESTIVDCTGTTVRIVRPGGIAREAISEALRMAIPLASTSDIRAPGTLASHYAPSARIEILPADQLQTRLSVLLDENTKAGVIGPALPGAISLGDPKTPEALAHALFAMLRDADAHGLDVVLCPSPPESGIGLAIADRLRRAAAPKP